MSEGVGELKNAAPLQLSNSLSTPEPLVRRQPPRELMLHRPPQGRAMDKIDISENETVPLDAIAAGVVGMRIVFVNVVAVAGESGWTRGPNRHSRPHPDAAAGWVDPGNARLAVDPHARSHSRSRVGLNCMGRRRTSRPTGMRPGNRSGVSPRSTLRSSRRATASRWPGQNDAGATRACGAVRRGRAARARPLRRRPAESVSLSPSAI